MLGIRAVPLTLAFPAGSRAIVRGSLRGGNSAPDEGRRAGDRREEAANEWDARERAMSEAIRIVLGTRGT